MESIDEDNCITENNTKRNKDAHLVLIISWITWNILKQFEDMDYVHDIRKVYIYPRTRSSILKQKILLLELCNNKYLRLNQCKQQAQFIKNDIQKITINIENFLYIHSYKVCSVI